MTTKLQPVTCCAKHRVEFFSGKCDICQMAEAINLALIYLDDGATISAHQVLAKASELMPVWAHDPTQ